MPKKIYKARTSKDSGGCNVSIFVCGWWRDFSTPFNIITGLYEFYSTKSNAKRGANKVAAELGITLDWEE